MAHCQTIKRIKVSVQTADGAETAKKNKKTQQEFKQK